jgi:hypothetical protein
MVMVMNLLLLGFLSPLTALLDDLDVVVEDCCDDGDHISLNNAGANTLGAPHTDVDDTLEGKIPFPHAHHISAATLLEDAD